MIGGGFGGSVLALAREDEAGLADAVTRDYADRAGREATPYVCASVDGAHEL
jgi:galactokinase